MISGILSSVVRQFAATVAILAVIVMCSACSDQKSAEDSGDTSRHKDGATVAGSHFSAETGKPGLSTKLKGGAQSGDPTKHGKPVGVTPDGPLLRAVEPVSGVVAPSEYLFLNSKFIPNAVVVVTLPLDYNDSASTKFPLLIAFGGAGECARPPREGAMAWVGYYRMDEAVRALTSNHLNSDNFKGLITPQQLNSFNGSLKRMPYKGVIVACPYSPLISSLNDIEDPEYERFIVDELVPFLKARYRVANNRTGVDGVSMGGARAMFLGLKRPETFSSIGSVQGAFGPFMDKYSALVRKNRAALKKHPIQLVTSDGDGMAPSVRKMSALLDSEKIPHTFLNLVGPHDYIFNQGPGSIAMLMFHARNGKRLSHGPVK